MIKKTFLLGCVLAMFSTVPQIAGAGYEEGEEANLSGNREAAFSHFLAAAEQGDVRAFGKLGAMYLYGLGTARDFASAYVWFSLAEEQGDKQAERFRMAASSAMNRAQFEQAHLLLGKKREQLAIRQLPPIK